MDQITLKINDTEKLDEILKVSEIIFKPNEIEKEKYHRKSDWLEKIQNGLLVSAETQEKVVGFAVCYKNKDSLHIWNVGVLQDYRKLGIWQKMYDQINLFAKKNNFKKLTLNTFKDKFPGMYKFVLQNNFTEYKTEVDEISKGAKSFFEKKI